MWWNTAPLRLVVVQQMSGAALDLKIPSVPRFRQSRHFRPSSLNFMQLYQGNRPSWLCIYILKECNFWHTSLGVLGDLIIVWWSNLCISERHLAGLEGLGHTEGEVKTHKNVKHAHDAPCQNEDRMLADSLRFHPPNWVWVACSRGESWGGTVTLRGSLH
jgi:hypothetical protein